VVVEALPANTNGYGSNHNITQLGNLGGGAFTVSMDAQGNYSQTGGGGSLYFASSLNGKDIFQGMDVSFTGSAMAEAEKVWDSLAPTTPGMGSFASVGVGHDDWGGVLYFSKNLENELVLQDNGDGTGYLELFNTTDPGFDNTPWGRHTNP
jgi:hypothetical protein